MKQGEQLTRNADEVTSLYRAVSPDEYYDLMDSKTISTIEQSMDAKQFGRNFDETLAFSDNYSDYAAIVEVKVPKSTVDALNDVKANIDTTIFKKGVVTIQPGDFGEFSKEIIDITHVY